MSTTTDSGYAYGYPYGPSQAPPAAYPVPARTRRPRSPLGIATASLALIAFGSLLALDATAAVTVPGVVLAAVPLLIVGIGILVAALIGARAGGLIALGVILLLVTASASHTVTHVNGGTGDRTWAPTTVAAAQGGFELGAGDAALDLTRVPLAGSTVHVTANVGAGQLVVTVPADATVTVDAHAGLGRVSVPDGSPGPDEADGFGPQRTVTLTPAGSSTGTLELDLQVGIGNVEVHRAYA